MGREFTERERASFIDGADVLIRSIGSDWVPAVVVGTFARDRHGSEYISAKQDGVLSERCYPTGIRTPEPVCGIDYVMVTGADGKPGVSVLFCRDCGNADASIGVRRNKVLKAQSGLSSAERYVPYVQPVKDVAHLDDYHVSCTKCTRAKGGWPTIVAAREYARRLALVRDLGYLPESANWNAQRYNLACYLESQEHRGMRSKRDLKDAAERYVANGWGLFLL